MCGTPPVVRRTSARYCPLAVAAAGTISTASVIAAAIVRFTMKFSSSGLTRSGNLVGGGSDRLDGATHRLDVHVGERVRLVGLAQPVGRVAGEEMATADQRDL